MKRSKALLWLLPALWALILTLGLAAYALNQNPAGLARSLADRLSDPEKGFTLSARAASFSLFPLPAVRLKDVTVRTPGTALFITDCAIFPKPWPLLRGALALQTVQMKEAVLLMEALPSSQGAPFALPPETAGARISLQNGTLMLLHPGKGGPPRPTLILSGLSASAALPGQEDASPTLTGGGLSLTVASVTQCAETDGTVLRTVKDVRLDVKDIHCLPSDAGASDFGFKAELSLPVPLGDTPPRAVLAATVRHEDGKLSVDGAAALDGAFTLPQQAVPVHALVPYAASLTANALRRGTPPEIAIKGATLKADDNEARFDGRMDFTGGPSSPFPRLRGTLRVKRLSLPRWFAFARDLPPGVQAALDTLSGTLPLELTPRGLSVTSATATALGTTFSGDGGIADFAHPVIALRLATPEADVNRLFPQLVGKKSPPPAYASPPVLADEDSGSSPGYDIRLSAARADFAAWKGQDVSVRITPDAAVKGEPTRLAVRCGSFYGGSVQADLLPGDELSLTLAAKSVKAAHFLAPLAATPPLSGTLTASATLTARPSSLADFLSSLRGSARLTLENGTLKTAQGSQPLAFSRLHLAFQGVGSAAAALRYGYKGQWQAEMVTPDWQGSLFLAGPLLFSTKAPFGVRAEAASASATVSAKGCTAKAAGTLSFDTATATASADALVGDVTGNGGAASFSGSLAVSGKEGRTIWEAPLSLSSRNPRPLLAVAGLVPADLPARAFRLADLKGVIRLDGETLRMDDMEGVIDDTRFSGQLRREARRWMGTLRLGVLNVADYLPTSKAGGPNAPWNVDWMRKTEMEGQISAERLVLFRVPHESVTLPFSLKNGILTADPIRARVAGGTAGAGFRAEAISGGLLGRLRYTLDNVDVLTLCKERGQQDLLSGKGSLDADVSGLLRSGADLPTALKGTLGFAVRNGELDARHPGTFSRFRSLSASGTLAQGILTTRDLRLDGTLSVRGYGSINLRQWTLDYTLNVTGPGIPDLPIRYYGSLDNPKRSLNAQGFLANAFGSLGNGILTIVDGVVSAPLRFLAP